MSKYNRFDCPIWILKDEEYIEQNLTHKDTWFQKKRK